MRIALVAGEASGDTLGAALIEALRRRFPNAQFAGVAGPRMQAAGCSAWFDSGELGVMGLTEVLRHLPRLLRLRRTLQRRILEWRPDVFVGVDFKEFNLGLARRLKQQGLRTVQYVSPQVWAWRPGRARTIGESVDLLLCLFPFEPAFYREYGVRAAFVGHPLADEIPLEVDRAAARAELGIPAGARVLAVLPGSRRGEVEHLAAAFAGAAELLAGRYPGLVTVAPMVTPELRALFAERCATLAPRAAVRMLDGQARRALIAADVALVASGTATLEAALCKRPMVVAYRLGAITAFLLRQFGLVKVRYFSQPNLLADARLVPEFFQEQASPGNLADALADWFEHPQRVAQVQEEFAKIHETLRRGGAAQAAAEIAELVTAWTAHVEMPGAS
ncbi:MAG TPA: lipid-A-disaccharide synthase [Steroidobacteraceae bacterium]|nr:lipid-A-disaccharide synthase [Steroidobacteraceae bacterium]